MISSGSILIYAFSNRWGTNISRRTLNELQQTLPSHIQFQPVYFHPGEFFRKHIEGKQYNLIIGLGDYYGPLSKIKIETQAKNSYNNQSIYPFASILLDLSLPNIDNFDSSKFQISSNMGSYNCNWIAYRTQLYINHKNFPTKHLFFHLPLRSNASFIAESISNLLMMNGMLK